MIAVAMPRVAETMIGDSTLGRMCRVISFWLVVPMERAAITNSRSFSASTSPRTIRAVGIQLVTPMAHHDQDEDPLLRPEGGVQRFAEQQHHHQQQRQERQRQEQVGQAHQRPVQPF